MTPMIEALEEAEKVVIFNFEQRQAFEKIISTLASMTEGTRRCFFIQGPAGTGKTFLYSVLCHHYRAKEKIVLCVASSGIASLLLPGGQTSHSRLCIPLNLHKSSICNINKNSELGNLLRQVTLLIWDEVPMQHRFCFEAVDRMLQDIRDSDQLFGGLPVVILHRACHHPPGISSLTEHVITCASHHPPGMSSPTGHVISHRAVHHPPGISSPTRQVITHRACHPTKHEITCASHHPPGMSSPTGQFITHRACDHLRISSPTKHAIPSGISSPTGHVITCASNHPPSIPSHRACHPTPGMSSHRACHPTPGMSSHQAYHPPPGVSSPAHLIT